MKEGYLTGAMTAVAIFGYGQNTATGIQDGTNQRVQVMQRGRQLTVAIRQTSAGTIVSQGNGAETRQTGIAGEAFINQIGSKSGFVSIWQENSGDKANTATVNQQNNPDGRGTLPAPNAPAPDVTKAKGNFAFVQQIGSGQQTTIDQNERSAANAARANQTNAGRGQTIRIVQSQFSAHNTATVAQVGGGNTASISQSNNANNNRADVVQGVSGGLNSFNATATVEQNGKDSEGSGWNIATIEQTGILTGARATIRQTGGASRSSYYNNAFIAQTRDGNRGLIEQSNGSLYNETFIRQAGPDGVAVVIQSDNTAYNRATVGQEGSRNATRLSQTGVGSHTALITQTGNDNLVQGFGTSLAEAGPMATQEGDGHQMTVSQTSPSSANTTLFNTANLSQAGLKNAISLSQIANTASNVSTIAQMGTGNAAAVLQISH